MKRAAEVVDTITLAFPKSEVVAVKEDNLAVWRQCEEVPPSALRPIQAGRLRGKSDINPQWRLRKMTEMYGPCGKGWWYTITDRWTETIGQEVLCHVAVNLHVAGYEHPIVGVGGNKLAEMESKGLYANDEGWKMALTDALSVAMKALGVGAAVYEGRWDGSKYQPDHDTDKANQPQQPTTQASPKPTQQQTAHPESAPMTVASCDVIKQGISAAGRAWTLYRLIGDVGGKTTEVTTFDGECANINAGDVVTLKGLTQDAKKPGVYKAQSVARVERVDGEA